MKNKKGFTIVELLVVIALISLLLIIAIPTGLSISKKIKINMLNSKIKQLESASVVWGQNNDDKIKEVGNSCTINTSSTYCIRKTIEDMLNTENAFAEDYKEDGVKHLKNPTNNESMNGCNIEIYINDNKRVYAKYDTSGANCYYNEEDESENGNDGEGEDDTTYILEYSGPTKYLIGDINADYFRDYITCKDSDGNDCEFEYNINGWYSESGDYTSENYKLNTEGDIELFIATKATNSDGAPMNDVSINIEMNCPINYLFFQYNGQSIFEDGTIDPSKFNVDCEGVYNGNTIYCDAYSNGWFYGISQDGTSIWEKGNSLQTISNLDWGYYDIYYEIPANNCGTTKYKTIENAIYIEPSESRCDYLIAENYSTSSAYTDCENANGVHNCYDELSAWDEAFDACQKAGCGC